MRLSAIVIVIAGCGRIGFDPGGAQGGFGDGASSDGDRDASTSAIDGALGTFCNPLMNVTEADCAAAFASPTTAALSTIWECGLACRWGSCYISDPADCASCSCTHYAKSTQLCDEASGTCSAPLDGTGCLNGNFYSGPPIRCPSTVIETEGACILRYLAQNGHC